MIPVAAVCEPWNEHPIDPADLVLESSGPCVVTVQFKNILDQFIYGIDWKLNKASWKFQKLVRAQRLIARERRTRQPSGLRSSPACRRSILDTSEHVVYKLIQPRWSPVGKG